MSLLLRLSATVLLLSLLAAAGGPPASASVPDQLHLSPVQAPRARPFVAPEGPYGPGHRGLSFAAHPGQVVRAPGPGQVVFAGEVARRGWVVIELDRGAGTRWAGVRATVGPLARIEVTLGGRVRSGDTVGTARGELLFTLRAGGVYLDPAAYLDRGTTRARLVPARGCGMAPCAS